MVGRRELFSLLLASVLLTACGTGEPPVPELPQSVSPGWTRTSFRASAFPAGIPATGTAHCWHADYSGQGTAEVWVCWYKVSGSAFDALQRGRAEAQAVKFQEGNYLVLVKWNAVPKANLTALVRAIQKALQPL